MKLEIVNDNKKISDAFKYGLFMGMSLGTGVTSVFLYWSTIFLTIAPSREHPLAYPISRFFIFASYLAFLIIFFFFSKNKRSKKELLSGTFFTVIFGILFSIVNFMLLGLYYLIKDYLPDKFLKIIANIFKMLTSPPGFLLRGLCIAIFIAFVIVLIVFKIKNKKATQI